MADILLLLQQYGVLIVFGAVLLEQIGLPIPAFPVLIVAGALAANGDSSFSAVLAVTLLGCLISDYFWYQAGRSYGKRILKLLCRISLSADYCVGQTEDTFRRWGAKSLIIAKFIPGFNTIAPPLAGAMGTSPRVFVAFSMLGGLLWGGTGIAIGAYFHDSVDQVLLILETMGSTALMVLGVLLALFVGFKYIERKRFHRSVQIERITVGELKHLIEQGHAPVMVDARSSTAQLLEPSVPGALLFNGGALLASLSDLDKDAHIIVYCSCPNDVTAAQVAQQLHTHGYHRAKPLHGGLDAWNSAFAARQRDAETAAALD